MGCTDDYWRRQVHEHTGRVVDETWDQEFGPLYEEALEADLREVAGIRQVLERLPWRYCVASNGSHKKIRTNLRRVGLAELFSDAIFSAEDVRVGKPSPELFLYAAQTMGFAPEQCIVVEDSVHGVRAARAAGMEVLAYAVGLIDPVLLEGPRTTIFTRMDDLSQLLIRTAKTLGKPQHSST
jgi:HAD superfamily hydrolase (TIGR01509 family)